MGRMTRSKDLTQLQVDSVFCISLRERADRRLLLQHACDADLVLDLHCDFEGVMLLYAIPQHWAQIRPLAARLEAGAVLLADDSGGKAFAFGRCC